MNKLDELKDLITALQKKEEEKQKNITREKNRQGTADSDFIL